MENVVDALYMAAAVLILLIALSVSISSFTKVKADVQQIITADERTDLAKDENDDYINYIKSTGSNRVVGVETVIPTIRKIQNESYVVYIKCDDLIASVPYAKRVQGSDGKTYLEITIDFYSRNNNNDFIQKIYNIIQDKSFNEYIGIYKEYKPNTPDADNYERRIIIYEEQ